MRIECAFLIKKEILLLLFYFYDFCIQPKKDLVVVVEIASFICRFSS